MHLVTRTNYFVEHITTITALGLRNRSESLHFEKLWVDETLWSHCSIFHGEKGTVVVTGWSDV